MEQALPSGLCLAPELGELLDWIEDQSLVSTDEESGQRFASPYSEDPWESNHPTVLFEIADPDHARLWLGCDDPAVLNRLAPMVRSGDDGSAIALWRETDSTQAIVHMGSGSGSTMAGVMTRDPVDLIRLLAIGYHELCWPEVYDLTPAEAHEAEGLGGEFTAPAELRRWVTKTFGKTIPQKASAIVEPMGDMDGDPGTDPFLIWLDELRS